MSIRLLENRALVLLGPKARASYPVVLHSSEELPQERSCVSSPQGLLHALASSTGLRPPCSRPRHRLSLLLVPSLLFEFPGSKTSSFVPIGSLFRKRVVHEPILLEAFNNLCRDQ